MMNARKILLVLVLGALFLSGCLFTQGQNPTDTNNFDAVYTQAAATVIAQLTQTANQTTPLPTLVFPTVTEPPATATAVPLLPTATPLPPTATPVTPVWTPTATPIPCNWLQFVSDVTIPDGTVLSPGESFVKTWKLKNIGSCTWTPDYDLVFASGSRMDGKTVVALPDYVLPGETISISVRLTAPTDEGAYQGYWQLRDDKQVLFGLGGAANRPFWVQIKVADGNGDYVLNFANNYCAAEWESGSGDELPCPGKEGDKDGFVRLLKTPRLEGRNENEPALWVRPNNTNGGWISGTFPEIRIKDDYHFMAWVGCLDGNEGCDVTFYLEYQIDGGRAQKLGEWHEVYDDMVSKIDIDLSSLAGKDVSFILTVETNNKKWEDADAFWFVPRIEKVDTN